MAKAGHIILGVALPVIGLVASIVDYNSDKAKYSIETGPSPTEIARLQTYSFFKEVIDSILAYKSIVMYQDSLTAVSEALAIDGRDMPQINEDLKRILMDSLFAGNYKPLFGDVKRMVLTPDGNTMGFKDFNEYSIEDYFDGASRYGTLDVVTFKPYSGISETFHWRYAGDTLVFTEMVSKDDGTFGLGEKSYRFLDFEIAYAGKY